MNNKFMRFVFIALFGFIASGCSNNHEAIEKEEARKNFYRFDSIPSPDW